MLSAALPPLRFRDWASRGEQAQAFALCYLASYAHNPIPSRVLTAFTNAYGIETMWRFPRVAGVTPNVLVSKIPYPWGTHLVIAIEGSSNAGQIWAQTLMSAVAEGVDNPSGRVVGFFHSVATGFATGLAAHAQIQPLLANARTEITFTGYSMGAGIAEILGAVMQAIAPTRKIRVRKFAAPRVGNAAWIANRPAQLSITSIFRRGDMMHCLPNDGLRIHSAGPIATFGVPTFYAKDPQEEYWDGNGLARTTIPPVTTYDQVRWAAAYLRTVTVDSPIYPHLMNSYRHMFCNILADQWDMDTDRFVYLEFPDDNKWQSEWMRGLVWDPNWIGLLDPAPAPVDLAPPAQDQLRLHNAIPEPANPPRQPLIQQMDFQNGNAVTLPALLNRRRNRHAPQGAN